MNSRIPDGGGGPRAFPFAGATLRNAQSLKPMLPVINEVYRLIGVPVVLTNRDLKDTARAPQVLEAIEHMGIFMTFLNFFLNGAEGFSFLVRQAMSQMRMTPSCLEFEFALKDPARSPQLFSAMRKYIVLVDLDLQNSGTRRFYYGAHDFLVGKLRTCPESKRVLDVGAGIDGRILLARPDLPRRHEICFLDKHPFVVSLLCHMKESLGTRAHTKASFVRADFFDFTSPQPFHYLMASLLLRYLSTEQLPVFFEKARSLMVPGGELIVVDAVEDLDWDKREFKDRVPALAAAAGFTVKGPDPIRTCGENRGFAFELKLS